jgi:uncharacterized protein
MKIHILAQSPALTPSPINPQWILDGRPEASGAVLSQTPDESVLTVLWQCTPGRFNWHYDYDEAVYFLEGKVTIREFSNGVTHHLEAGASILFTRGSSAEWTVTETVTKIAVVHSPLPQKFILLRKVWRAMKGRRELVGALA